MEYLTQIVIEEQNGLDRVDEPVTFGVPLPRGKVIQGDGLVLVNRDRQPVPLQVQVLNAWPDGSVKWALLDFSATVRAMATTQYELCSEVASVIPSRPQKGLIVQRSPDAIVVNTGSSEFVVNTRVCKPFEHVTVQGGAHVGHNGSRIVLTTENGQEYEPRIHAIAIETDGPVRATLAIRGCFSAPSDDAFANFLARLSFYAQSGLVELTFTLHNPRAARHPGGLWDLGDEGSIYFRDVSLYAGLPGDEAVTTMWKSTPTSPLVECSGAELEIYQDSSGGPQWQSPNHLNRFGRVTPQFCGYRVVLDGDILETGKRALPTLTVRSGERSMTGVIPEFWQNFPKALEVRNQELAVRFFPAQCGALYELQGGEQKTHTVFIGFQIGQPVSLDWVHNRLLPRLQPEWYTESKTFHYVSARGIRPEGSETMELTEQLVDTAVSGETTFFDRREIIDEYGWRHFGDLYADHEAVGWKGDHPLIAHYNNQYDVVYGALVQYIRGGHHEWFQLANELAKHVIDIDIYRTQEDRPVFNGGLFWHTDHYTDAATATHRTYSKANLGSRSVHEYGGGPSNEHNYTTGLLYYYFLTGDSLAKEAVQSLADWVINLDTGTKNLFSFFDRRPTGRCSATVDQDYHGPGRGCGNSINALLDAYCLTQDPKYLAKAEALIQRCIHPQDDIATRNLGDIEHRWSYTVFLQVLGKYLALKVELGSLDYMYGYAQESLLHYTRWMLDHEAPYSTMLERVEIPTETWPAQDIRKSVVFLVAATHAGEPLRSQYLERARFFFDACIHDLLTFPTCRLTRPVVLLMTHAFMYGYSCTHPDEQSPRTEVRHSFRQPQKFTPQLYELYKMREKLRAGITRTKKTKQLVQRLVQSIWRLGDNHG
jgi:hypothetical protein